MTKKQLKEKDVSSKQLGGDWDEIWEQESTSKKLDFFRKLGRFYLEITKLISKQISDYTKKENKYLTIEIGCGGSSYIHYLKEKHPNLKMYGIDKSMKGCLATTEILQKKSMTNNIVCGDLFNCPFKKEKFDIVFSVGLLEHFKDPKKALEKHVDMLKPGGLLICIVPNILGYQRKFFNLKLWKNFCSKEQYQDGWVWGIKTITMDDFENWFNDMNIKKISIRTSGGIYPTILMDSYRADVENDFSLNLLTFVNRCLIFPTVMLLNIPFLFKFSPVSLSPFITAVGIKK